MYNYTVQWRFPGRVEVLVPDPERESFSSNNAREAAGAFLSRNGGCSSGNFGRTLRVNCDNTGEGTFWACIRVSQVEGRLVQTDEHGEVINDFPTINEILRRHNLPEIKVEGIDLEQLLRNVEAARWAEQVTVKAVMDDSTCETCRGLNEKRLGDALRLGYNGPPFHAEDDDRGPCRCSTWGPSPLKVVGGLL